MFSLGQRPRNWNQSIKALKARFNALVSLNPVFGAGSFGVVNPGTVLNVNGGRWRPNKLEKNLPLTRQPASQNFPNPTSGPLGSRVDHETIGGIPTETSIGPLPGSNFNPDGTITLVVPKSAVGSPAPGDLLGAVNGRTFTGDTPETQNLERSTLLVDHTFVKGQRDNGHPAATYTLVGNLSCGP